MCPPVASAFSAKGFKASVFRRNLHLGVNVNPVIEA
jgi:hypothetical protein